MMYVKARKEMFDAWIQKITGGDYEYDVFFVLLATLDVEGPTIEGDELDLLTALFSEDVNVVFPGLSFIDGDTVKWRGEEQSWLNETAEAIPIYGSAIIAVGEGDDNWFMTRTIYPAPINVPPGVGFDVIPEIDLDTV